MILKNYSEGGGGRGLLKGLKRAQELIGSFRVGSSSKKKNSKLGNTLGNT